MALPRKLKHMNLFGNGVSFIGQAVEVKLPVLKRLMESYRGGGMTGPAKIDMGQDELTLEATFGGLMREVLNDYGLARHDGVMLRFAGGYQRDDTGGVDAVEVVTRGRWEEIDSGSGKPGDDTEFTTKLACTYYKLSINSTVVIELDLVNMIEVVNGVDRLAEARRAIGIG